MYIDNEIVKIIAKNIGLNEIDQEEFVKFHGSNMMELIFMKIFNYYAKTHTKKEKIELEELMQKINKYGKSEDQKKLVDIVKNTITEYPNLSAEIREQQNEIHSKMIFDFLERASNEGQVELLTHMLNKKKLVENIREKIDNLEV